MYEEERYADWAAEQAELDALAHYEDTMYEDYDQGQWDDDPSPYAGTYSEM